MAKQVKQQKPKKQKESAGEVRSRFNILLLQKSANEGRRIPVREVANVTGINVNTLARWMNNRVTRYDADKLAALCKYLDCTVCDLLEYLPPQKGNGQ